MTDLRQAAEMALEAMKQALDALNTTDTHPISSAEQYDKEMRAMEALDDAIEDAIEQAEKNDFNPDWDQMAVLVEENQQLAKRKWVGLTNDEITEIDQGLDARSYSMFAYTRAIKAKLKEKNT
jgi:hypothetical protein